MSKQKPLDGSLEDAATVASKSTHSEPAGDRRSNTPEDTQGAEPLPAVVIDLGKVKKKQIRKLKDGGGPLLDEVEMAVDEVRQQLTTELKGRELLPVVIVYEAKRKKKRFLPW